LNAFAEAINTKTHLDRFERLAKLFDVDVDATISEIEKNLQWTEEKLPEIAIWVENEKGSAVKVKFSITILIFSIFVMVLQ
jgi:hypothetical protein